MTNKNRKEYANALSKLGKWNYTTYFRGQWKITHEYAEKLAMRLMKSRVIKKVFFIKLFTNNSIVFYDDHFFFSGGDRLN